jgi:diguanylate cyclase (GGDEF)-like protein
VHRAKGQKRGIARGRADASSSKILLIEGSATDAQLLRLLLRAEPQFSVTTATRLARGVAYLGQQRFDLILLDLSLPDGQGLDVIGQVHRAARDVPIVALSTSYDESLALRALREGAQDLLVKCEIDRSLLMRVIRYACERHRLLSTLQSLALMDTLTGLYNRRGFVTIADEQLKLARRTGHSVALAFVDLNGMKRINDELGHEFGDQALVATAHILKSTFRASDVIARLGATVIVCAMSVGQSVTDRIRKRLLQSLARHNQTPSAVPVSFSMASRTTIH